MGGFGEASTAVSFTGSLASTGAPAASVGCGCRAPAGGGTAVVTEASSSMPRKRRIAEDIEAAELLCLGRAGARDEDDGAAWSADAEVYSPGAEDGASFALLREADRTTPPTADARRASGAPSAFSLRREDAAPVPSRPAVGCAWRGATGTSWRVTPDAKELERFVAESGRRIPDALLPADPTVECRGDNERRSVTREVIRRIQKRLIRLLPSQTKRKAGGGVWGDAAWQRLENQHVRSMRRGVQSGACYAVLDAVGLCGVSMNDTGGGKNSAASSGSVARPTKG